MDSTTIANAAAMTAVVTLMVSLFAPFVESLPGLANTPDNGPRHDAALRLLNILLNVAVVFIYQAATTGISAADVMPLALQALAQAAGAHFAYHIVTAGSGSGSAAAPADNGTGGVPPAAPPDVPPAAPSIAALGLPDQAA